MADRALETVKVRRQQNIIFQAPKEKRNYQLEIFYLGKYIPKIKMK